MDPLEIHAMYRQRQLLDEASARALARSARSGRAGGARPTLATIVSTLRGRIGHAVEVDRRRTTPAPQGAD